MKSIRILVLMVLGLQVSAIFASESELRPENAAITDSKAETIQKNAIDTTANALKFLQKVGLEGEDLLITPVPAQTKAGYIIIATDYYGGIMRVFTPLGELKVPAQAHINLESVNSLSGIELKLLRPTHYTQLWGMDEILYVLTKLDGKALVRDSEVPDPGCDNKHIRFEGQDDALIGRVNDRINSFFKAPNDMYSHDKGKKLFGKVLWKKNTCERPKNPFFKASIIKIGAPLTEQDTLSKFLYDELTYNLCLVASCAIMKFITTKYKQPCSGLTAGNQGLQYA
ncbi:hypothetical protein [Endozoicomonas euniceicola]|uniref:Uncharacterized protein n=1 Tax=Endozoicomonas euniceicola TaxID=1234143 RepID=A0ABY6GWE0_9GAMM|nr:hypothetical protein [Endozoicomonas euniceicola]UYM16719.1 hypothetical protein NX720_01940 [Endozoicomonas euniceicola]